MEQQDLARSTVPPPPLRQGTGAYIPSLDGLRAISISMVIYGHLSFGQLPNFMRATTLGNAGVILFFSISGYLITRQLQAESVLRGVINIPFFLARRLLRLLPALFALILVSLFLARIGVEHVSTPDIFHALTYTTDYYLPASVTLQHLWSLAVEEQFYLLWPLFFTPLFSRAKDIRVALGVVILCPLIRAAEWSLGCSGEFRHFECVADCLAAGCLLALRVPRKIPPVLGVLAFACMIACCFLNKLARSAMILTISVEALCAFCIIAVIVSAENDSWLVRLLTWKPLVWLGKISYSLYLWQQMFLMGHLDKSESHSILFRFPFDLIAALLVATASYYWIEAPFRRLGRRFRVVAAKPASAPCVAATVASVP